jgi:TRIAD3 protein (E3 ubiquitin-protein ligase RNF216)
MKCKGDCGGEFRDSVVTDLLSEAALERLAVSEKNHDVWEAELNSGDQYYFCRSCTLYWIGQGLKSDCPLCFATICGKCWEDESGESGCRCGSDSGRPESEEDARSDVVIRKCPRCRTPFVKEAEGCNHVTCSVCEADICYFCGEWFRGNDIYREHFYRGEEEDGKCPMYSTYAQLHDDRAEDAAVEWQRGEDRW